MDNKIIVELIKKDIEELKLIVEALEKNPDSKAILIDIATSKTKSLLHEISLLNIEENNSNTQNVAVIKQVEQVEFEKTEHQQKTKSTDLPSNFNSENDAQKQETIETSVIEETLPENMLINSPETFHKEELITETKTAENTTAKQSEKETLNANRENTNEKSHLVLGETFVKEPSINERFTTQTDNSYKVKGKPVTSIKGALGLNDRFMFTRELFDNDKNKFEMTIDVLDKAEGYLAAIEYLEQNFQWQKNNISLKFMELVKRRFNL